VRSEAAEYLAYNGAALPTMLLRPAKLLGALSRRTKHMVKVRILRGIRSLCIGCARAHETPVSHAEKRAASGAALVTTGLNDSNMWQRDGQASSLSSVLASESNRC